MTLQETARHYGFDSCPVAGIFSGRIAICASARCLWEDLRSLKEKWAGSFHVMAVKMAGLFLPMPIQHWAGQHGERFQLMLPLRGYHLYRNAPHAETKCMIHSERPWPKVTHVWPGRNHGTSALFATRVALALGYDEVVLCGTPLDGSGRFYDAPWANGGGLGPDAGRLGGVELLDMSEWERHAKNVFDGRVKSMSGKTRELLGGI